MKSDKKRAKGKPSPWTDVHLTASDESMLAEEFFCAFKDSPIALSCYMLYKHGEFDQLVSKDLDPLCFNNLNEFRDAYACVNFLRKSETLKTSFDREAVAFEKFRESEAACASTNRRFRNLAFDPEYSGPNVWLLNATIRKISQILDGDASQESAEAKSFGLDFIDELLSSSGWGPGSTTCVKGLDTSAAIKFKQERHISLRLYHVARGLPWNAAYPLWAAMHFPERWIVNDFGKVTSVPKNAKTDRTICVEPGINLWFQKGAGKMIRRRLRKHGVDLNHSSRNEKLARRGSLGERLTCVDFEAASDTIAKSVVRTLLPPRWATLLEVLRSENYVLNGSSSVFEKFSSMGNGFTFELESLIFYAAAIACRDYVGVEGPVSVFGDDVVLPSEAYQLYASFTKFLGFKANLRKTASSGYFRESCGAYWWNGVSVKPFYNKKGLLSAKNIVHMANSVRMMAHRCNGELSCDARFKRVYKLLVSSLPKKFKRLKGTVSSGAGCLHQNFDEATPVVARLTTDEHGERRTGWGGYFHPMVVEKARTYQNQSEGLMLAHYWTQSGNEPEPDHDWGESYQVDLPLRLLTEKSAIVEQAHSFSPPPEATQNRVSLKRWTKAKVIRAYVHHWYDFGPWI